MEYCDLITSDIRLVLLRLLKAAGGYSLNSSILHKLLGEKTGYQTSRDRVRSELSWLKEQGLVKLAEGIGCDIATITQRGLDVADGSATVPGVNRPSPGN